MEHQRTLLAERRNFRQCAHAYGFAVGILCGVFLKPLLFQGNEIELICTRELPIEPILINKIAETSLAGSSFDKLVIPGLRKIAQLRGRNVADVNLMRRVGRGRTKASEMILQLLFKRRIGPNLSRRLGTISDEIGDMSQRIEHALDTDTYCFGWVSHDKSGNDLLPSLLGKGMIFQEGLSVAGTKKDQSNFLERGI